MVIRKQRRGVLGALAIVAALPCAAATQSPSTPPSSAAAPGPNPGDTWVYRTIDLFTGIESQRYAAKFLRREALDLKFSSTDQKSGQTRPFSLTFDLGGCSSATSLVKPSCAGPYAFPIKVGDRHSYERLPFRDGYSGQTCTVEGFEKVVVPAGTFDAYRVVCAGRWTYTGGSDAIYQGRLAEEHWYAPSVNNEVKVIRRAYGNKGGVDSQTQTELVSFRSAGSEGPAPEPQAFATPPASALDAMPAEFTAGTTRFAGRFAKSGGNDGYSGDGKVIWTNGDVYEGHIERGAREGQGKFSWSNGQRYEGEWHRDAPQGKGTLRFVNGDVYEGEIDAGTATGEGTMVYGSGDRYAGHFAAGIPDGEGTYTWRDGSTYVGQWRAGLKHGHGVLTWANGDRWDGAFADDRQGEGTLTRKAH